MAASIRRTETGVLLMNDRLLIGFLFAFAFLSPACSQVPHPPIFLPPHPSKTSGGLAACQISKVHRAANGVRVTFKILRRGVIKGSNHAPITYNYSDHIEGVMGDTVIAIADEAGNDGCSMTVVKNGDEIGVNVPEHFHAPGQPDLVSNFFVKAIPAD